MECINQNTAYEVIIRVDAIIISSIPLGDIWSEDPYLTKAEVYYSNKSSNPYVVPGIYPHSILRSLEHLVSQDRIYTSLYFVFHATENEIFTDVHYRPAPQKLYQFVS